MSNTFQTWQEAALDKTLVPQLKEIRDLLVEIRNLLDYGLPGLPARAMPSAD